MSHQVSPPSVTPSKLLQQSLTCLFYTPGSALSPPRPYPPNIARFKLAGAILGPLFILTAIVPAWIWHRAMSFLLGAAFFGQPLIDRGLAWFVKAVPDWREKLDLRK